MNTPNLEQQAVIDCPARHLLCVAGPGSGKTRTLLWRIEKLVREGADPSRMVIITFTNAAADELTRRLGELKLGYVGTLHRYMLQLLSKFGENIGLPRTLTVVPDYKAFIAESITVTGYKGTIKDLEAAMAECPREVGSSGHWSKAEITAAHIYSQMIDHGTLTFDGILRIGLELLRGPRIPLGVDYLFVDEYQDSSNLDADIYEAMDIAMNFIVGDPDQAIYGFRGGNIRNIIDAGKNFETRTLQTNYRCPVMVCQSAQNLISNNSDRCDKITMPATRVHGFVSKDAFAQPSDEIRWLAKAVRAAVDNGSVAVLLRYNKMVEQYALALESYGIPVARSVSTVPMDWDAALLLIALILKPDDDYLAKQWVSLLAGPDAASVVQIQALEAASTINEIRLRIEPHLDRRPFFLSLIEQSPLTDPSRALIQQIAWALDPFTGQDLLLRMHAAKWTAQEQGTGVVVTTLHQAKGREFDTVFMPGMEEHIIPSNHPVEEERRLTYVGITRAKGAVHLSYCHHRESMFGFSKALSERVPSRFLAEMGL